MPSPIELNYNEGISTGDADLILNTNHKISTGQGSITSTSGGIISLKEGGRAFRKWGYWILAVVFGL